MSIRCRPIALLEPWLRLEPLLLLLLRAVLREHLHVAAIRRVAVEDALAQRTRDMVSNTCAISTFVSPGLHGLYSSGRKRFHNPCSRAFDFSLPSTSGAGWRPPARAIARRAQPYGDLLFGFPTSASCPRAGSILHRLEEYGDRTLRSGDSVIRRAGERFSRDRLRPPMCNSSKRAHAHGR